MKRKTCCVTGHRKIEKNKIDSTKQAIRAAIMDAIKHGYTHFISGFSEGVDLYFADIVAELKEEYTLSLEAAIPYRNRVKAKDAKFQHLLKNCNTIGVYSEVYKKSCFLVHDRLMVQASELVIAVYDGRESGGTLFTMRYAHITGKELNIIHI